VSTLEKRPALGLNTWDKVALRCPRPWRGLSNNAVSSMECLKHQGNLSLNSWCLAPTPEERPITAAPYRSLHGLSFPWVSGSNAADDLLCFWRFRPPPQSLLPVGIGGATPSVPYTGDAFSVLYWRRHQRLSDALCGQSIDFGLDVDLDFDFGQRPRAGRLP